MGRIVIDKGGRPRVMCRLRGASQSLGSNKQLIMNTKKATHFMKSKVNKLYQN